MSSRCYTAISAVMYLICFTASVCLLGVEAFAPTLSNTQKFITALMIFVFGVIGSKVLGIGKNIVIRRRITRNTLLVLFVIYIMIIVDFTLIDYSFGRDISNIFAVGKKSAEEYIRENTNIIPFATIKLFAMAFLKGSLTFSDVAVNLIGNFFVFMPMSIFLPIFFPKADGFLRFVLCVCAVVVLIELLQLLFLTGSSDIDDLILNVSGAAVAYGALGIKRVSLAICRFTDGVWER